MITAILNGYRRQHYLDRQIEALRAQTVPPQDIMIWHNAPGEDMSFNTDVAFKSTSAYSMSNLGVWARFAFALNARTEYICIFDDDTFPGSRWFENCLATMQKQEALLGTVGLLYHEPPPPFSPDVSYKNPYSRHGWVDRGNNLEPVQVDFVGHAWFFRREWLSTFWRELPDPQYSLCGEDMHFSFMLQKYLGIPTIVPPHPPGERDLWGSIDGELGNDSVALSIDNTADQTGLPFYSRMSEFFVEQRRKGWKLVNDK